MFLKSCAIGCCHVACLAKAFSNLGPAPFVTLPRCACEAASHNSRAPRSYFSDTALGGFLSWSYFATHSCSHIRGRREPLFSSIFLCCLPLITKIVQPQVEEFTVSRLQPCLQSDIQLKNPPADGTKSNGRGCSDYGLRSTMLEKFSDVRNSIEVHQGRF